MPKKEKEKERPLPRPPRKKAERGFSGREEAGGLMFDKLQEAVAQGRVEEFMEENMPEGQYSRKLAEMMMGMSGAPLALRPERPEEGNGPGMKEAERPTLKVPKDVLQAAMEGNVNTLSDLLKREQGHPAAPTRRKKSAPPSGEGKALPGEKEGREEKNGSLLEKEVIDSLLEISVDNNLPMDWLIYRALKLYIKKYRETGQL